MLSIAVDNSAVRKLSVRLGGLAKAGDRMLPLMEDLAKVVVEDNRRAIMAGIQGDGSDSPMPPVTYRGGATKAARARSGDRFGFKAGQYKGPAANIGGRRTKATPNNGNLTSAQYRKLSGPPLAPRGDQSRIIANLLTGIRRMGGGEWVVEKQWRGVVSAKGFAFLSPHFLGKGRLPRRDMRKVTSWGRKEARRRASAWLKAEALKGR